MQLGALGDIHGDFATARRIVQHHPDVPFWLCVGDIADEAGRYEPLGAPVWWIKGNNENFDLIASGGFPAGLHYIPNGTAIDISLEPEAVRASEAGWASQARHLRVAGLGGTYAPTVYDLPARDLPHPKKATAKATELADRRRQFVRDEVEACTRMTDVDILLTHEAARPYRVNKGIDAGKTPINEVLAAMKPRLHLFGHHHRCSEQAAQGVRSIGLDLVSRSYLLIDAGTLEYDVVSSSR
jgi:Calcineurin-like phosphoesterase.